MSRPVPAGGEPAAEKPIAHGRAFEDGSAANAGTTGSVRAGEAGNAQLGRRNDRLLLIAVAAYAVLLSVLMVLRGISVTPDIVVIAFGLAALLLGRARLFLRDWIPFLALFFAYELMRGYAYVGQTIHAADVVAIERFIGFGHLPTVVLQQALHHGSVNQPDPLAFISVIFYFLHFPLPLAIGFLLWLHRRSYYYDFVAALILLSIAGFATYLVLPVAPPWWVVEHGVVSDPILHLRDNGFSQIWNTFGLSEYVYTYQSVYAVGSNDVAAFPSLHAAYPFLAFLFARRAFGRPGWLMFGYTLCIWFAIVYLGEHWLVDIIGGVAYAVVAYWLILHAPGWYRRFIEKAEDTELEAGVEAENAGQAGALRRLNRRIRWALVGQGLVLAVAGAAAAYGMNHEGLLGGTTTALYLVPWAAVFGGLWRAAAGLLSS